MINYYHKFIPHAADSLAPLNYLLSLVFTGVKTQEAMAVLSSIKTRLENVALLAHPVPNAATILTHPKQ